MDRDKFVILHPRGRDNPSTKFRIVQFPDWVSFIKREITRCPHFGEFATYKEADQERTRLKNMCATHAQRLQLMRNKIF